jgi:hypothetical protein
LGQYLNGKLGGSGIYRPININLYRYASQNPLVVIDPTGNSDFSFSDFFKGFALKTLDNTAEASWYSSVHPEFEAYPGELSPAELTGTDYSSFLSAPENLSEETGRDVADNALTGLAIALATRSPGRVADRSAQAAGKYLNASWHKGTFPNKLQSVEYHLAKHGKGRSATQYTKDAMNFFEKNKQFGKSVTLSDGTAGIKIQTKVKVDGKTQNVGGYWTNEGKLVTFWD